MGLIERIAVHFTPVERDVAKIILDAHGKDPTDELAVSDIANIIFAGAAVRNFDGRQETKPLWDAIQDSIGQAKEKPTSPGVTID